MSTTDFILVLIVASLIYLIITLKLIAASVERIAGISHYQQQSPFRPSIRAEKAPTAPQVTRPVKDNGLIDIADMPEDQALEALENWGNR